MCVSFGFMRGIMGWSFGSLFLFLFLLLMGDIWLDGNGNGYRMYTKDMHKGAFVAQIGKGQKENKKNTLGWVFHLVWFGRDISNGVYDTQCIYNSSRTGIGIWNIK